jgi:hypothetical protein
MPAFFSIPLRRLPAFLMSLRWTYVYVMMIPAMNWGAQYFPTMAFKDGGNFSALSIVVGLILVVRDFAQREIGHWVFIPLLIGAGLSYILSDPILAIASALAFIIGESVDWAVYTFTKRPLSSRILISSAFSVPVDTAVFLYGWNMLNPGVAHISTFAGMIISKMLAAYAIYILIRRREENAALTEL